MNKHDSTERLWSLTSLPAGFMTSLWKSSHLLLWFLLLTGPALFMTILDPPWNRFFFFFWGHMLSEHESHDSGSFTQLCWSYLGVYEVSIYHGHKGLNVLCKAFTGQRQTNMWDFSRSRRNDFVTGGFSVHTNTIKQCKQMSEDKLFLVLY